MTEPSPARRGALADRAVRIALPSSAPGTERTLTVLRFGNRGARPKAYLQASLHADELPGMLVLRLLAERLAALDEAQRVRGEVVLVPVANPIGLAQMLNGQSLGRYAFSGEGNFNRGYPDLVPRASAEVGAVLGDHAADNVATIRAALVAAVTRLDAGSELAFLRRTLLSLAIDADFALDLHCDLEAVVHCFFGDALWPGAEDLARQLGSRANLLAPVSGGNPFDEAVGGPWWALAKAFPDWPIPPACLTSTVELRGKRDVAESHAGEDAENLLRWLARRGVVDAEPGPLPEALCEATPLSGADIIRAERSGLISHLAEPGARVEAGEAVATLLDPVAFDDGARTTLRASTSGILYGRAVDRLARPGSIVCKVAGKRPLAHRVGGYLLSD